MIELFEENDYYQDSISEHQKNNFILFFIHQNGAVNIGIATTNTLPCYESYDHQLVHKSQEIRAYSVL